ncbi:hypothetical protein [Butyrivibrio sp. YAB3001]|uniref:hypothetical protein n=1 Tax=Butyrivibrio sp. YAB3001 TaxID=1520812 RepID=UPI0008F647C7|nr:hypothetical protein [Butyrivibrio sp. YAB3001]SFB66458.1 hypothetical protein SAMN02910398_00006 [Butyrivibrio sp. YAB3001]
MAGKRDSEITVVVPKLTRNEARYLRDEMIKNTRKIAPGARGSIAVGKKENFESIMHRCVNGLLD